MHPFVTSLTQTKLARNIVAVMYGQGIQLAVQIVSVPVLISSWGLADYGVWLILFTVPAFLAMADFGLTFAAANEMSALASTGDRSTPTRIFGALQVSIAVLLAIVLLAATAWLVLVPASVSFANGATGGQGAATALALIGYGLLALQNGVTLAGFRTNDSYARGGFLFQTVLLVEYCCALTVALAGGGLREVAFAYLITRAVGSIVLYLLLRREAAWLTGAPLCAGWSEIRGLAGPALATMAIPAANGIVLQGSVIALGAVAGPAAVPAFTTVRTLTRTALQMAYAVNVASLPRYTIAVAGGNRARQAQLVLLNLALPAVLLLPAAVLLLLFGGDIIAAWTGGGVVVPAGLIAVLTAAMVINGAWVPLSHLMLAVNRHAGFAYLFVIVAAGGTALGFLLAQRHGAIGVAWGVAAVEVLMALWVFRLSIRLGIVDHGALASAARTALGRDRWGAATVESAPPDQPR